MRWFLASNKNPPNAAVYRARAGKLSISKTPNRGLRYNRLFVGAIMTVGELMEILSEIRPELKILVAKDQEGNKFTPCREVTWGLFDEDYELCDPHEECKEHIVIWP